MKRHQKIFVYSVVGIMAFSAFALSLLVLVSSDGDDSNNEITNAVEETNVNDTNPNPIGVTDVQNYLPEGAVEELEIVDVAVGEGDAVGETSTVTVDYTGWLAANGEVFDSSVLRGQAATFAVNQVIAGWQLGLQGMLEGGKRRLVIPAALAYGEAGAPPSIPANADLVFEVGLIDIQ